MKKLLFMRRLFTLRPITFFTIGGILTAFDSHFQTATVKLIHILQCIAGGMFIELLANVLAIDIIKKSRKDD